jgi:acyl-CoA dehydrogenase
MLLRAASSRFPDDYWLARDRDGGFPHELHAMLAADGWLGIAMPEPYGGRRPWHHRGRDHDASDR